MMGLWSQVGERGDKIQITGGELVGERTFWRRALREIRKFSLHTI